MAERRSGGIVTILFTDLVGSTELLDELGDEEMEKVRRAHFQLLREAVKASAGQEVKNLGDGLMVVFDSALDAIGCAVAMQEAIDLYNQQASVPRLMVRVGLHAGEPIQEEGDYFGTPVVVAQRLCAAALGGQIIASDLVRALVGTRGKFNFHDLGPTQLKGFAAPLPAIEVVWGQRFQESMEQGGVGATAIVRPPPAQAGAAAPPPLAPQPAAGAGMFGGRRVPMLAVFGGGLLVTAVVLLVAVVLAGGGGESKPASALGPTFTPTLEPTATPEPTTTPEPTPEPEPTTPPPPPPPVQQPPQPAPTPRPIGNTSLQAGAQCAGGTLTVTYTATSSGSLSLTRITITVAGVSILDRAVSGQSASGQASRAGVGTGAPIVVTAFDNSGGAPVSQTLPAPCS